MAKITYTVVGSQNEPLVIGSMRLIRDGVQRQITVEEDSQDDVLLARAVQLGLISIVDTWGIETNPYTVSGDGAWDVVLTVGGQSNAEGRGAMDSAGDGRPVAGTYLYLKGGTLQSGIVPASEPAQRRLPAWVNNIPAGVSPGQPTHSMLTSIARWVLRYTGQRPMIVPCAIGSTNLDVHWAPPALEDDMSTLFGAMTRRTRDVQVSSGLPPVFVWFGHEANAAQITESLSAGTLGTEWQTRWSAHLRALRSRWPDCWVVYCQLSTTANAASATQQRRMGEAMLRCDGVYGDRTTMQGYEPTTYQAGAEVFWPRSNNATNVAAWVAPGVVTLVGDGGTPLGAEFVQLVAGQPYRITVNISGTGACKFQIGNNVEIATGRTAGTHVLTGTGQAADNGKLMVFRNAAGQATNLRIEIVSVEIGYYIGDTYSAMVVTHDVPRNAAPDDQHKSARGLREIGRRVAAAYAERVLRISGINGTGPRLVSVSKSGADVVVKFDRVIQADANGYGASLAASLFRVYLNGTEQTLAACARDGSDTTAVRITCAASVASGTCVVTYGDRTGPATETTRPGCVYDLDGMPAPMFGPRVAT